MVSWKIKDFDKQTDFWKISIQKTVENDSLNPELIGVCIVSLCHILTLYPCQVQEDVPNWSLFLLLSYILWAPGQQWGIGQEVWQEDGRDAKNMLIRSML